MKREIMEEEDGKENNDDEGREIMKGRDTVGER